MNSMEVFEAATIEIFQACLNKHPLPTEIETPALAIRVAEYFEIVKDENIQEHVNELDEICLYTIIWLKEEDFLRDAGSTMDSQVLHITQKGLGAINSIPKSIEGKSTFRELFKNGLGSMPFSVTSSAISEFLKSAC